MSFDATNLYLAEIAQISIKLMDKEMNTVVFRRCERCRNNEPNELAHQLCNELDSKTKDNNCFDAVFAEIDIFLANKLFWNRQSSDSNTSTR